MKSHYCAVRQSILDKGQSVPVGKDFYGEPDSLEYRWMGIDDDEFEVLHEGVWQNAESADWEFFDDDGDEQFRQQREEDDYENDSFTDQQFG